MQGEGGDREGKDQDRGKCRDRVKTEDEPLDMVGRNAGASAEGTVGERATVGKVRGHDKGRERQDKLECRVVVEMEGRERRKNVSTWWAD